MIANMEEQILKFLITNVKILNGENTEEELNMAISKKILKEKVKKNEVICRDFGDGCIKTYKQEEDKGDAIETGAWVYSGGILDSWVFDRHDTIAGAIKQAVRMINASVLIRGKALKYDTLDGETAYYVDEESNTVKTVRI
jgi:hypothetical protein